jgi:hypothetical protein
MEFHFKLLISLLNLQQVWFFSIPILLPQSLFFGFPPFSPDKTRFQFSDGENGGTEGGCFSLIIGFYAPLRQRFNPFFILHSIVKPSSPPSSLPHFQRTKIGEEKSHPPLPLRDLCPAGVRGWGLGRLLSIHMGIAVMQFFHILRRDFGGGANL